MKKLLSLILAVGLFILPMSMYALAPKPTVKTDHLAKYHFEGRGTGDLYVGAFVCKVASCLVTNQEDWYNYSSTPGDVLADDGEGITLEVAPGDNLTFLGEVMADFQESIDPNFKVEFTGDENLENIDILGTGKTDLDDDTVNYTSVAGVIGFDSNIGGEETHYQLGSITAKVKDNTPDGAIITAKLYYEQPVAKNPFVKSALAADTIERSSVRIVVRDPQETTVLPRTGIEKSKLLNSIMPFAVFGTFVLFIGYQVVTRRKKQVK